MMRLVAKQMLEGRLPEGQWPPLPPPPAEEEKEESKDKGKGNKKGKRKGKGKAKGKKKAVKKHRERATSPIVDKLENHPFLLEDRLKMFYPKVSNIFDLENLYSRPAPDPIEIEEGRRMTKMTGKGRRTHPRLKMFNLSKCAVEDFVLTMIWNR